MLKKLRIWTSTIPTQSADEDHVIWLKALNELLQGPWSEIVFSTHKQSETFFWLIYVSFLLKVAWNQWMCLHAHYYPGFQSIKCKVNKTYRNMFAMVTISVFNIL